MSDEKKLSSSRRHYAVLSRDTIRTYAEAGGHDADLPDELASLLAEEVVYRLRELTQTSCQFMRHAKRRKLTAEDFNRALRQSDCQPVFGHGAPESVQWRQTREGEINFVEDMDTGLANLACSSQAPHVLGETTLRAHWLAVEGCQKTGPQPTPPGAPGSKPARALSDDLQNHYDLLTKALLSKNTELLQVALEDLRKNTKIAPLLPNMVNFITNGIRKLNQDTGRLLNMLYTVDCLLQNNTILLESQPYMSVLVDCVRHCALEPLGVPPSKTASNQWLMRDYAANLLAKMIHEWDSPVNHLQQQVTQGLSKLLCDPGKPFCSHYGAITILTALGQQCFEEAVLPHLSTLWPHMQAALDDTTLPNAQLKIDAAKVYGALQAGAVYMIRLRRLSLLQQHNETREASQSQPPPPPAETKPEPNLMDMDTEVELLQDTMQSTVQDVAARLYAECYNYFGDSVSVTQPIEILKGMYKPKPLEEVSLADEDSKKSGQELLQQFLPASGGFTRGRGRLDMEDLEFRGYDPNPDDMDLDYDMDEKSERSSERSHSDENFSFLGEDIVDLTVKATVGGPGKGIKLFIGKKAKSKTSEAESQESGSEHMKSPPRLSQEIVKKISKAKPTFQDLFEASTIKSKEITFVFRYAGRIQRCKSIERRKSLLVETPIDNCEYTETEYHRLCSGLGPRSKMRQPWNSAPAKLRRRRRAHKMCSLDSAFF